MFLMPRLILFVLQ
jgi:hypothetical protein